MWVRNLARPYEDPVDGPPYIPGLTGDASDATVIADGGTASRPVEDYFGDTMHAKSFGVVADGVADDTLAATNWLNYGISSGKALTFNTPIRLTADITLTGAGATSHLKVYGAGDATFLAGGAERIKLSGTFGTVEFDGVNFEDFTHSPLWLGDDLTIGELRLNNCKGTNNLLFLSAQGNPAQAGYTDDVTHIANAAITVSSLRITNCDIVGGRAGIVLPIVIESAIVDGNSISGLSNAITTGNALEHGVCGIQLGPLGGNVAAGDFEAVGAAYSTDYNRIQSIRVTNNKLDSLVQDDETKQCMGIGVNGFGVVVAGNTLRDITSPGGADAGDANNNDNEAIYSKAANANISYNTFHNCGSTEALIAVKSISAGQTDFTNSVDQPGWQNIVHGNNATWDTAPAQGITFCIVFSGPCTITNNSARGITNNAFEIYGDISGQGQQYPIVINDNYMEGPFDTFVLHRGGINSLIIGRGNIANVIGGDGTCSYYLMSQGTDGNEVRNVVVSGLFRIRDRDNSVLANVHAAVSTGTMNNPVRDFVVENLILDVKDASNSNIQYRLFNFSVTGTPSYKGMVFRDIVFPIDIAGAEIIELPNLDFEYVFDNVLEYTTVNATLVAIYNTRVAQNHCLAASIVYIAHDVVTGDRAMYHQDSVWSRTTGNLAGTANTLGTPLETDATWNIASTFSTVFFQAQIAGDATNPTQWKVHVKVTQVGSV